VIACKIEYVTVSRVSYSFEVEKVCIASCMGSHSVAKGALEREEVC
jgi:hypothetical protein